MNATAPKDAETPSAEDQPAEATPATRGPTAFVLDTTATPEVSKRTHQQLIDGKLESFTFTHNVALELPYAIAMKFSNHESFIVTKESPDGARVMPAPAVDANDRLKLAADEVVANLDELKVESLYQRAASQPGGEKFKTNTKRDVLISFLHEAALRDRNKVEKNADPEAMDGSARDKFFEGA